MILTSPVRSRNLDPMLEHLILSVVNLSPHLVNVGVIAAEKLMQALARLSEPTVLLGGSLNWRACAWMLEALETVVRKKYQENLNVIYSLCHNQRVIDQLRVQTFDAAMDSVQKRAHILRAKDANDDANGYYDTEVDPWEARDDKWRPTEAWWHSWHHSLPTSTLVVLHGHLQPQIEQVTGHDAGQHWPEVLATIQGADVEGVLPPANEPPKRPFDFGAVRW
ncbi:hypothetical protein M427DRAFT_358419 [Gonapodya prolifera JEL478]|uniref:Uncharacterized protein n=1 Tax=Gonapodya prolifera (strain JEL478) TaxID=1344416 RepID=A0A139AAL3_GONPJ|nr:hypothetical protein M427DRAFT_358419 [Gonapodya prolifera JEL478]|eukprot:KXS13851.1 hypothetical protein M427DRAFT_358419 [Gonapodya prolifera JEL478]